MTDKEFRNTYDWDKEYLNRPIQTTRYNTPDFNPLSSIRSITRPNPMN